MLFNLDKCHVMHIGFNNPRAGYTMNGNAVTEVTEEKDLGVTIQSSLKWNKNCAESVSKANKVLGLIRRTFRYLDKNMFLSLYKSLVRPHLEYSIQAWSPHLRKDIDLMEKVQRRATKMILSLEDSQYEDRLR